MHDDEQVLDMEAVYKVLRDASYNHGIKSLAFDMGKSDKTLYAELNCTGTAKLALHDAILILYKTHRKHGLEALDMIEAFFGRAAYAIPSYAPGSATPLFKLVARLTKEFGEQMQELAAAMDDDEIDHKEARRCLKELDDVLRVLGEMRAYLTQAMET